MAKLYFRHGAMNSGKSTLLLQTAHNYEEKGKEVVILKPKVDTKGEENIVSRMGISRKVDHLIENGEDVFEYVLQNHHFASCVLVDEAQFIEPFQADELLKIVVVMDIPVICYGLRLDFQGKGFPGSTRLLEIAQSIEELKTVCECGRKAMFNARFVDGEFTLSGDQVAIDGENNVTYESLCHYCFYRKKIEYKEKLAEDKKAKVLVKK